MAIPVDVTFKGVPVSDAVREAAWKHGEELERYFDRILSCRVVIEMPHRHGRKGGLYMVRIGLSVPGSDIIVNREGPKDHAHEDVYVAMRDAFDAARRRLEDHVRRLRGDVKIHPGMSRGRVARLIVGEDYGFLTAADGREVYFHRNSLVEGDFDHLNVGDEVRFLEEQGRKGPQATAVHFERPHRLAGVGAEAPP